MALTVPPPTSSFSEFGWIFHNNHLDSSIYQDDSDIMEFSDSSAEYQTSPQQQAPQVSFTSVNHPVTAFAFVCLREETATTMMLPFLFVNDNAEAIQLRILKRIPLHKANEFDAIMWRRRESLETFDSNLGDALIEIQMSWMTSRKNVEQLRANKYQNMFLSRHWHDSTRLNVISPDKHGYRDDDAFGFFVFVCDSCWSAI